MSALELPRASRGARAAGGARRGPRRRRAARRRPRTTARSRTRASATCRSSCAPGDLLVVNTSATLPAALAGARSTSEPVELHLSTPLAGGTWVVELRGRRRRRRSAPPPVGAAARAAGRRARRAARAVRRQRAARRSPGSSSAHRSRTTSAATAGRSATATSRRVAARRLPDGLRARAGQRRDAERGPAVHRRARHASSSRAASWSRRSRCTRASPRPSAASRPTPSATACPADDRAARQRRARLGRPRDRGRHDGRPRARDGAAARRHGVAPAQGWTSLVVTPERGLRASTACSRAGTSRESSHLQLLEAVAGARPSRALLREALDAGYRWHEFGDLHLILAERPGSAVEARAGSGR